MEKTQIITVTVDVPGSPLSAVRDWLEAGLTSLNVATIGAQYTGDAAGSISLVQNTDSHDTDITGADVAMYNYALMINTPYGPDVVQNLASAALANDIASWVRTAEKAHDYPDIAGYIVDRVTAVNPMIISATADTALYSVQIQIHAEQA